MGAARRLLLNVDGSLVCDCREECQRERLSSGVHLDDRYVCDVYGMSSVRVCIAPLRVER